MRCRVKTSASRRIFWACRSGELRTAIRQVPGTRTDRPAISCYAVLANGGTSRTSLLPAQVPSDNRAGNMRYEDKSHTANTDGVLHHKSNAKRKVNISSRPPERPKLCPYQPQSNFVPHTATNHTNTFNLQHSLAASVV